MRVQKNSLKDSMMIKRPSNVKNATKNVKIVPEIQIKAAFHADKALIWT